jgi:hypothetical protein
MALDLTEGEGRQRSHLRVPIVIQLVYQRWDAADTSDPANGKDRAPPDAATRKVKHIHEFLGNGSLVLTLDYFWSKGTLGLIASQGGFRVGYSCRGKLTRGEQRDEESGNDGARHMPLLKGHNSYALPINLNTGLQVELRLDRATTTAHASDLQAG